MTEWLDTPGDVASVVAVLAAIGGALFWIIDARLAKMQKEFKPNGGASIRDQLDRIEAKIDGHINWHMERRSID